MLQTFSDWLVTTELSHLFADNIWTVVMSQTIHIIGVAVVMVSVAMINLRILGVAGRSQSIQSIVFQFSPWIWWAMLVLLLTGILQTLAEPAREIMNMTFRIKLLLLVVVCGITYYYAKALREDPHFFDAQGTHRAIGVTLASFSIVFWVVIVVCSRLVAYIGAIFA
nr:MAG: hypothetical protein E4H34_02860 [Hyphomicrobiales bacterium]